MSASFMLSQSSTSMTERPQISYRVREYLENFIAENLLKEKKIILGGKWRIDLVLAFQRETVRYTSTHLTLGARPTTVNGENVKIYEVLIPIKLIKESSHPYLRTIELMWEAISLFFTENYKKVSPETMSELWKKIDLDFLLSLPYPAPLIDQKYTTDTVTDQGEVKDIIQWGPIQGIIPRK
jgi:hypothetical protein